MNKKILITIGIIILIVLLGFLIIKVGFKGTERNENNSNEIVNNAQIEKDSQADKNEQTDKNESTENNAQSNNKEEENKMYNTGKHHAKIEIKNYGTIELELDADVAPITVANFAKLVNEGFYNGLTFHRIIDGFMIQGGDPEGTGMGGSSENIKGEFLKNGVKNTISHVRGTVSMARSSAYNSASSQFFIVHKDSTFLDGQYAGFGKVTSGIEIVDKICEDIKVEDDNGTVLKTNQPIIEKIQMID